MSFLNRGKLLVVTATLPVLSISLGFFADGFALGAEVSENFAEQTTEKNATTDTQDVTLQIRQAQSLFDRYQALENAYDPALKDLYANTADIRVLKIFPDGEQEGSHIPAEQYKQRINQLMPVAKAQKDKGVYFSVEYVPLTQFVRIKTKRRALPNNEIGYVQLIVGPSDLNHPEKEWQIYEEYFENHLSSHSTAH